MSARARTVGELAREGRLARVFHRRGRLSWTHRPGERCGACGIPATDDEIADALASGELDPVEVTDRLARWAVEAEGA